MAFVQSGRGFYEGSFFDVKKSFNLNHKGNPIFERRFDGSSAGIVSTGDDNIYIPNHFFVTGEEVSYTYPNSVSGTINAVGIATTSISGVGVTDKLPKTLYIVKSSDLYVKVAASASEALQSIPKTLDINKVGIETFHTFICKNQNSKVLLTVDNVIQSPIVSTSTTTSTSQEILLSDGTINFVGINSFFIGDLVKIQNEIMKITSVGVGQFTNKISVQRSFMGTVLTSHPLGSLVTKIVGDYNITDNILNFSTAPYGLTPEVKPLDKLFNSPDEQDYVGIATRSKFNGRVFLRSGTPNTGNEPYYNNYIFDDISSGFAGLNTEFTLKSNFSNISGISSGNAIILINDIFQQPSKDNFPADYSLKQNLGITSISFSGFSSSFAPYDINTKNITRGGIIVSISSTEGFGYQPLVSAGGTAVVSAAGTISSISIGNSGSGYRVGIQTTVRVGVTTLNIGTVKVQFIGTAAVSNGNIVSIAITNPGIGYTRTNPPLVVFDDPLSYSNIPLIYSSLSVSGFGTQATVDILVGQGSSVIGFELKNLGYDYGDGEILTFETGGRTGIPTNTSLPFKQFKITVNKTFTDKFNGWRFGDLQVIDSIDNLFNGTRINFPIKINKKQVSLEVKKGSNIDLKANLLIFINDIPQVPDQGYFFKGGSIITFSEAPKNGDKCKILFYKGTGEVDVVDVDILETIKVGDIITINSDFPALQEDGRLVAEIISSDVLNTNVYSGPGITTNQNLQRSIEWCRQTEDKIIDGQEVAKDRILYEALIYPSTNLIKSVGITSTVLFVESVKTFFDSKNEFNQKNNKIIIISQDSLVAASATAIVSAAGTISSIIISDGGVGYSTSPKVSIAYPIGYGISVPRTSYTQGDSVPVGLGTIPTFISSISVDGKVSEVSIINAGSGYTSSNPPITIIEPPTPKTEVISNVTYDGDFGVITGIKTTTVGVASTAIVFDFYISQNSFLRDTVIVGAAITVSGIQTGYYFTVYNSNVGNGVTSLNSDGSVVGVGSTFLDNIYRVSEVSIGRTSVPGVGVTYVSKVTVSLSSYNGLTGIGFSGFYGEYSWGLISVPTRINPKSFDIYNNGILGISTSPIVKRYNPLKYQNYLT